MNILHAFAVSQIKRALYFIGVVLLAASLIRVGPAAAKKNLSIQQKPAFPLKLSANHRYLVDQNNLPFLMVGDSPQGLMGRLTEEQIDAYFAVREAHGFNSAGWIDVACASLDFSNIKTGGNVDGLLPFTGFIAGGNDFTHYDLSKPNDAYFAIHSAGKRAFRKSTSCY